MEIPWRIFHGILHGHKTLKLHGECVEFHVEYYMELPWNTTSLRVFKCFTQVKLLWKKFSVEIPWSISRRILWCLRWKRFPWQLHLGENVKTPWGLRGIPCEILHGIAMEHHVFHGNSQTSLDSMSANPWN